MAKDETDASVAQLATQRLNELLSKKSQQGHTQAEIAAKAGIQPQYLSDIKRGERPVTELIARRLGEEFDFSYRWLMGTSDQMELASPPSRSTSAGPTVGLPLLLSPTEGEPRQSPNWNGYIVEIAGLAAGRIGLAERPYVLQFNKTDPEQRLHQGDWILISQASNPEAEIRVVRHRKKLLLARPDGETGWKRVAKGKQLTGPCTEVGHCVGIIWSPLC